MHIQAWLRNDLQVTLQQSGKNSFFEYNERGAEIWRLVI